MLGKVQRTCGPQQRSLADVGTPAQKFNRDWVAQAACRARPEVFYAHKRTTQRDVDTALALCQSCPVRRSCLQEALTHEDPWGIWGGTAEDQRAGTRAGQGHRSVQRANQLRRPGRAAERPTAYRGREST